MQYVACYNIAIVDNYMAMFVGVTCIFIWRKLGKSMEYLYQTRYQSNRRQKTTMITSLYHAIYYHQYDYVCKLKEKPF
jgi:hypothetical protein